MKKLIEAFKSASWVFVVGFFALLLVMLSGCERQDFPEDGDYLAKDIYCHLTYADSEKCDEFYEDTETSYYTQEEVDELLEEALNDNEEYATYCIELEGWYWHDGLNQCVQDIDELTWKIRNLERDVESLEIMIDILARNEYNTVESQCDEDYDVVCYNNNFYYHIIDEDSIDLIFGVYNEFRIDMRLRRQEDGDFYTVFIGYMTADSGPFYLESYEVMDTTHYSDTAASLIQDIIEDADWEYFVDGDPLIIWDELKQSVGVGE